MTRRTTTRRAATAHPPSRSVGQPCVFVDHYHNSERLRVNVCYCPTERDDVVAAAARAVHRVGAVKARPRRPVSFLLCNFVSRRRRSRSRLLFIQYHYSVSRVTSRGLTLVTPRAVQRCDGSTRPMPYSNKSESAGRPVRDPPVSSFYARSNQMIDGALR